MEVAVKEKPMNKNGKPAEDEPGGPIIRRRALVARRDFATGEVIYRVNIILSGDIFSGIPSDVRLSGTTYGRSARSRPRGTLSLQDCNRDYITFFIRARGPIAPTA